jgi:hypothetical protein
MNTTIRLTSALLFAGAFVAGAHAEYRCDPAPSSIDQRACNAAQQGPDSLRRFVERWDSKMSNLYFGDYVDAKTAQTWNAKSGRAADEPAIEDRTFVEMPPERIGA